VYELTGCYASAGALPGGRVRQANLRMLAERAAAFDQRRDGGLAAFLWEAEQLRERGDSLSAKALGESEDVVRIMTIHMSKGLEFPIVICLDLNRNFLRKGGAAPLLNCHASYGLALRMVDPALRTRYNTLPCDAIGLQRKKEALADATRLLYVAMTRAMDRLILIGRGSRGRQTLDDRLQRWAAAPGALLTEAQSMLDLLLPAIGEIPMGASPLAERLAHANSPITSVPRWSVHRHGRIPLEKKDAGEAGAWLKRLTETLREARPSAAAEVRLGWTPPTAPVDADRLKTTVSALLRRAQGEAAYTPPVHWPLFLEEGQSGLGLRDLSGAARGTAFHAAMRGLDLSALRGPEGPVLVRALEKQLDGLLAAERLRENERLALHEEEIAAFFEDDLGRRMLASKIVRREWAFNLRMGKKETTRLVQGVLDCCFQEPPDGGWVLVDYKTDTDTEPEAVLSRYAPQIALYAQALKQITDRPVQLAVLYLVKHRKCFPYAPAALALTGEALSDGEFFK
jgi:ATP-dependent helicase/nuclease subunit A